MKQPLVTVFIPVYNAEKYIKQALKSVIEQSYKNIEILIINDGSSDGTLEIISGFKDTRIKVINNEENRGLPYTRSRALSNSNGKYLALLDADDVSCINRITKQVKFLEYNNRYDVVFTDINIIGKNRSKIKKSLSNNKIKYSLLYKNIICNSSVMIRKEKLLKENLVYNMNYFVAQDYRFWVDCIPFLNFGYLPERLVSYRRSDDSITNRSYKDKKKYARRLELINEIHKIAFKNLNIEVTDNELAIFNKVFNESMYAKDATLNEIMTIYEFMQSSGCIENINYSEWIEVLEKNTLIAMLKSKNVPLRKTIMFYLKNVKRNNLINCFLIVNSIVSKLK